MTTIRMLSKYQLYTTLAIYQYIFVNFICIVYQYVSAPLNPFHVLPLNDHKSIRS